MPTSVAGNKRLKLGTIAQRGWTLLELLVVLGILVLVLGMVVQSFPPADQRQLQRESAKLLSHLDAARSTSMMQARPLWLVPTPSGWVLGFGPQGQPAHHQEVWPANSGFTLTIAPAAQSQTAVSAMRIGPDPVMPLHELRLTLGTRSLVLHNPTVAGFEVRP